MKRWKKEEEDYLRDNASQTKESLANKLNRSVDSIERKLYRLGLMKKKTTEITPSSVRDDVNKIVEKQKESENAKRVKILASEILKVEKERDALLGVSKFETYTIKSTPSDSEKSEATTISLFSDLHGEEEVKSSQVNGVNKYNPDIAKSSTEKFFKVVAQLIKVHQNEYDIKNHICALLGDFISGSIHDDLKEGNKMQPTEAIWMVGGWILSGLKYLRQECPEVNLIIPCSLGNHCVDEKTEILTNNGFVKSTLIKDDDIIASFDKKNGEISYDKLIALRKFSQKGGIHIYGNHKDELVSREHNLVINNEFVKAKDFTECSIHDFRHCGEYSHSKLNLTDNELRLITWVVMDGTIVDGSKYVKNSTKKRIQFKLSKERKIEELKRLLTEMEIPFTFKPATMSGGNILQPYYIRIYGDYARKIYSYFDKKKEFPINFKELSKEQLLIVLDTIKITDGREINSIIEWSSVSKSNVNTIQLACINNGICANYDLHKKPSGFKESKRKPLYVVNIYPQGFNTSVNRIVRSKDVNKTIKFVGIQTKNGTLITRRNGIVNYTGNSRITEKQRVSTEYGNSLELLLYNRIAEYFENDDMVKVIITDAYFTYVDVYGKTLAFSHGHNARYNGGVGGLTIPLNKAIAQWDKMKKADYYFLAHFHSFCVGSNFIVNGSVIGYNAYALSIKAGFERPTQTFSLINKERDLEVIRKIILR